MVTHRIKNNPHLVVMHNSVITNLQTGDTLDVDSSNNTSWDYEKLGIFEPTTECKVTVGVHITDAKESLSKAIQQISAAILNRFFTTDCEPVNEYLLLESITFSTIPNTKTTEGVKDEV